MSKARSQFTPKPDITAWELAQLLADWGMTANWDWCERRGFGRHFKVIDTAEVVDFPKVIISPQIEQYDADIIPFDK